MSNARPLRLVVALAFVTWLGTGVEAFAQVLPNPYRAVDGWAQLPDGRKMGAVGGVTIDPDGEHIWAVVRCYQTDWPARFGNECLDSDLDPILKFDLLSRWTQFGRPSGIFFDENDQIYVADSESDDVQNPGWEMGIRIGDARTGWVTAFVLYPWGDPRETTGNGAEFVAVDRDGNLYGGEPRPRKLQKYVRVRP